MSLQPQGRLVPVGGGDPIPLRRAVMTVGRRESCDICLKFPSISSQHCELSFRDGYWFVRDLGSTNGLKVNGERVQARPLRPGDELSIAKRVFILHYDLPVQSAAALEDLLGADDLLSQGLLEKAGLKKRRSRDDDEDDDD